MNGHRQDPAKDADDAPKPSERSQRGLDWLNFFVADVQTSFGPFRFGDLVGPAVDYTKSQ